MGVETRATETSSEWLKMERRDKKEPKKPNKRKFIN